LTNKEIARQFQLLGNIMQLHGENAFKIRSYQNAYLTLRKLDQPLSEMEATQISSIKGVGKAISGKIQELLETGQMATLERYKDQTPEGVQDMLNIKGFGPKKIAVIWKELGVESIGELLYAVNENRLIELKGFGKKTQEDLKKKLEYYQKSKHLYHYATILEEAALVKENLSKSLAGTLEFTGPLRRKANTLSTIELISTAQEGAITAALEKMDMEQVEVGEGTVEALTANGFPVRLYLVQDAQLGSKQFRFTSSEEFLQAFIQRFKGIDFRNLASEEEVFAKVKLPFIAPELREQEWALDLAAADQLPDLITEDQIKGVLHAHSTYSDGLHSLKDMAEYARGQGYEYLGMTDHSQSAFYANGLKEDRVLQQFAEIDQLNKELAPFKIFKGIESDILNDGRLDYPDELLSQFDFIIASVHSNLRMDEAKATQRILTAVENPYTTMLGHPTGRLLLSREGYPLDHQKIIDACAANGVSIELNANPYRLDLDWSWIPYALEKGVKIAINPDAHSQEGIHHIKYGVASARKGGLTKDMCVNCWSVEGFEKYLSR
jgi:DNA polymerase (family 10)